MSITTQVVLKDKELEKIDYFVNMGYFEDEKALIESALRKFLYELGLADIRRRPPPVPTRTGAGGHGSRTHSKNFGPMKDSFVGISSGRRCGLNQ